MSDQIRPSRRQLLTAVGRAGPVTALAVDISGPASASSRLAGDPQLVLTWHDITAQTEAAAAFPEPGTRSRTWAVSCGSDAPYAARLADLGGEAAMHAVRATNPTRTLGAATHGRQGQTTWPRAS